MTATTADAAHPAARHSNLSVLGAAALVAGSMIGSGVYLLPASLGAVGSISILGWVAATVVALAIAAMFAQLAQAAPAARGVSGYVQEGLGRFFGTQATILYWASDWVGTAAIALAAAGYLGFLIPALADPTARLAAALAVIWAAVAFAWLGPRLVGRIETFTLVLGLAPVVGAAVIGWLWFDPQVFVRSWNPAHAEPLGAIRGSALTAFWAFLGLECAAAAAGVVRDPARNVPRATLVGVTTTAALYIAACAVLMGLMPAAALARSSAPFADAGRLTVGLAAGGLMAACAFLRASGCVTGWVLVTSETTREAADQGAFLPLYRTRPGERASPINLITTGALMSLVAILTATPTLGDQFARLATASVILSLAVYVLAGLSLYRLRGRFGTPGARRLAGAVAVAAVVAGAALIASGSRQDLLLSLVPVAIAAALYLWMRRR